MHPAPDGRGTSRSPLLGTVAVARATWGLFLLSLARPALERTLGRPATPWETRLARVLGAREVMQAAVVSAAPRTTLAGQVTDLAHLASMLLLAAVDRRRRRAALVSATVAGILAAAPSVVGSRPA